MFICMLYNKTNFQMFKANQINVKIVNIKVFVCEKVL